MPFVVVCPNCQQPLTVDEALAGSAVGCPTCHQPLAVPRPLRTGRVRRAGCDRGPAAAGRSLLLAALLLVPVGLAAGGWAYYEHTARARDAEADLRRVLLLEELHEKEIAAAKTDLANTDLKGAGLQLGERAPDGKRAERILSIEREHRDLLGKHPNWNRPPLKWAAPAPPTDEQRDYKSVLMIENRHRVLKSEAELHDLTGDTANAKAVRDELDRLRQEHWDLVAKYPGWQRAPLAP